MALKTGRKPAGAKNSPSRKQFLPPAKTRFAIAQSALNPTPIVANANIAIIGAGAAGLMAAITAAVYSPRASIVLLDSREKIGAKILISGGTRCNVTNVEVTPSDYQGGPSHFVRHVLEAFTPQQTIEFFKKIGVELVLEPSGKYFPVTHSGKTVLDALSREADRAGVKLTTGVRIEKIKRVETSFQLESGSFKLLAQRVILATGGLSYPETGSDGTGFRIAGGLGHTIVSTSPALTPLTTDDEEWKSLSGISLDAALSFFKNGRKKQECTGAFLFTHFGFSGPVALDISRHAARCGQGEDYEIRANFVPQASEESLKKKIALFEANRGKKSIEGFLQKEFSLPERFVKTFLKKIGTQERRKIIQFLLSYPLPVSGVVGYKKAEVTAGGVDLNEVRHSTMESKRVPGLYFCGEILDVDGRIGGFNFQWAWSSGVVAGRGAVQS